jgi:hypothetical protein
MVLTAENLWLYHNREYIEAHERLQREESALRDLIDENPEQRENVAEQTTRRNVAVQAIRELRERLIAAH